MDLDASAAKRSGPAVTVDNDPLAGKRELTDRPPDDWAVRYGLQNQGPGPFLHTNKSWITPSFPSFDRRATNNPRHFPNHFQDHKTLLRDGVPAPVDLEADLLFTTERIQQHKFAGLRTWEAALLQDVKAYQSGNELAGGFMLNKRLIVGEAYWLPVFKKHRWIDYNVKVRESGIDLPRKYDGRDAIWSVDNPAVWEELRPCIELANRLLCMATRGSWLPSLMDSSAHETSHGVWYSMDLEEGDVSRIASSIRRFVNVDRSRRLSPAVVGDLLKTTDHLISWSFFGASDEKSTPEAYRGQSPCIVDCQAIEQSGKSQMTISLDVALLKPLMSWNLNVTDKAVIQHTIGVNLLLAYADALARSRGLQFLEEERKLNPELQKPRQYQMFFGDEITADHRASFSKSLFGAKLEFPLYQNPSCGKTGFQVITTAREFPLEEDVLKQLFAIGEVPAPAWYTNLDPHKMHKHTSYPVPNIWQASMMNEDFWRVHVTKFGIKALQVPKDIQTENIFHAAWSMKSSLPIKTSVGGPTERRNIPFKDKEGNNVKLLSNARPFTGKADTEAAARLGRQLEHRRTLWDTMRKEWYPDMHADWEEFPHANIDFREDLRLITDFCFVRRSDFDEFRAHEIARRWIAMGNFATSKDKNIPDTFRRNALMCRAIGLAVMGALPARKTEKRCLRTGTVNPRKGAETWRLSKEAKASKMPIKPFETWWADDPAPEFVLPVRHKAKSGNNIVETRIAVLEAAMAALKEYEAQQGATSAVSRPLRAQIRHCLHVLRDNAVTEILYSREKEIEWEDGEIPTIGPERWLDMFFRLSDYTYSKGPAPPSKIQAKNLMFSKDARESISDKKVNPGRLEQLPQKSPKTNWWSVGQVAEQNSLANLWVLVWTGREYWVYNVTPCIHRLRWSEADMEQHIQYTENGRVLKNGLEETFGNEYAKFAKCKGRMKRWYRESDIAAMDPKDRKIRAVIGDYVYSTSEAGRISWRFFGISENSGRAITRALAQSKPGRLTALQTHGLEKYSRAVQKALKRYRCGRVKRREFPIKEGALYTLDELSWFWSERTGMYTAINGTVYDLTDFFKWHPGGRTVLREHAVGKDATEVFNNWHAPGLEESIKHLAIGRIVEWHDGDTFAHDEFLTNNYVYKLGIAEGEELDDSNYLHRLYKASKWFHGPAADDFVRRGNEAALRLARHTELVVAKKPVIEELPAVAIEDTAECDGFVKESKGENMAWIAVGNGPYSKGFVYDVSSIVRNPFQEFDKTKLLAECGRRTDNVAIARWLRENHGGRLVATFGPVCPVFDEGETLWRRRDWRYASRRWDEEKTAAEDQDGAGNVGNCLLDVKMVGSEVVIPSASEGDQGGGPYHSRVNKRAEQRRPVLHKDELRRQEQLRAEAREQLKRAYPQTPLVKVRPLAKGEKPPAGRDPIDTDKDKHKNLPPLPEVWPYGISSMFKDTFSPEMKKLAAAYVADQLAVSRGGSTRRSTESESSKDTNHLIYSRIAPILRTYAHKSEDNDFGDPGKIEEGEDDWIAELKRLGILFDEAFLREFEAQVAEDPVLQAMEERVLKRKRVAEEEGRELKKLKLSRKPKRVKAVTFASPMVVQEVDPSPSVSSSDSEDTPEYGWDEDFDEVEEDDRSMYPGSDCSDSSSGESEDEVDSSSPIEPDDGDQGWSGYTYDLPGNTSFVYHEDDTEERKIDEYLFGSPGGFSGETGSGEDETTQSDDAGEEQSDGEDVDMGDSLKDSLLKDEDKDAWEKARRLGNEAIAASKTAWGTEAIEAPASPKQSPEDSSLSSLDDLDPEDEAAFNQWYVPGSPADPQREAKSEPRAESPYLSSLPEEPSSSQQTEKRLPTREETTATIRERLPLLLRIEREIAEQAARSRIKKEERMKQREGGFYLPPHTYPVLEPEVPWEMRPSEFSLRLREREAEERGRKGPLAAARNEHGRRI